MKNYRDIKNVIDTVREELGIEKGKESKAIEMAKGFIRKGYPFSDIADGRGLYTEKIGKTVNSLKK